MRKIVIILGLFILSNNFLFCQKIDAELVKYVDFLKLQKSSAKDYILNMWTKYDVVILCERNHGEMTQYNLIYNIIQSDYFINNVGNIFTEIGSISEQKDVQHFINTNFISENDRKKELLELYRNIEWPYWEKSNFYFFLEKLSLLNTKLKNEDKINLFVSNIKEPFQNEINSKEDYLHYLNNNKFDRDSVIAENIINVFDSIKKSNTSRKKCLVIMNYRHAFSKTIYNGNSVTNNVGNVLFDYYAGRTANIYLNSLALTRVAEDSNKNNNFTDYIQTPIQDGIWDASFKILNIESLGFDFDNSPFGEDSLDIYPWSDEYKYKDIFTGFAFYLPLDKHYEAFGIPGFLDNGYEDNLYKRVLIFHEVYGGDTIDLKEEFNYSESKYDEIDQINKIIEKWIDY